MEPVEVLEFFFLENAKINKVLCQITPLYKNDIELAM
jgi:hypothetical protein